MPEPDRAILVRMVVLALAVLFVFSSYTVWRRATLAPPGVQAHVDGERLAHLQALLHAVVPATAAEVEPAGERASVCDTGSAAERRRADEAELARRLDALATGPSPFLTRRYRLDAPLWLSRAALLPGGCRRAAETLTALLWADRGRGIERQLLTRLDWRERFGRMRWRAGDAVHVTMEPAQFERANPWIDPPGCVLLTERRPGVDEAGEARPNRVVQGGGMGWPAVCRQLAAGADDAAPADPLRAGTRAVPRDLELLAADLAGWREPASIVYRTLVGTTNRLRLPGGRPKPIGLHVWFTFDPALQGMAQALAECYAGNAAACRDMGIPNPGEEMREGARVRQVGVAIIDVPSGELRAAASAESPCMRHDLTGVGPRPADCPDLGAAARSYYRQDVDAMRNRALFTVAPPGSTIKPIMGAGFLQDPRFGRKPEVFVERLKRSQSRIFLDWLFCRSGDGRGGFPKTCPRPALVQSAAHGLGWNEGCDTGVACGRVDLLFGRPLHASPPGFPGSENGGSASFRPSSRAVLLGRLLVAEDEARLRDMSESELWPDPQRLAACAAAEWDGAASACRRSGLAPVSEGYGQGSALASPVGVASLMAQLAANAEHGGPAPYPHVVRALLDAQGRPDPAGDPARWGTPTRPHGIDPALASRVLQAMTHSHRPGGTASGACRKVFGKDCGDMGVAGKTGTTSFGPRYATLAGFRKAWEEHASALAGHDGCMAGRRARGASCSVPERPPRPWRWYAGVFKSDPAAPHYDKAFAVLVERNWTRADKIDQIGGEAVNSPAIEMGMYLFAGTRKARE